MAVERLSNKRAARFIMFMFGVFTLLGALVSFGYHENIDAVTLCAIAFVCFTGGRLVFPTD